MPVIIITGYPSTDSAIQSINLPVVAYMVKPFDMAELLENVKLAVTSYHTTLTVNNTLAQLNNWQQNLEMAGNPLMPSMGRISAPSINAFLSLTLKNIVGSLLNIKALTESLAAEMPEVETCQLLGCPRQIRMRAALEEAIEVLIETKDFCKSKKLGMLRKKLEEVIKEENRSVAIVKD